MWGTADGWDCTLTFSLFRFNLDWYIISWWSLRFMWISAREWQDKLWVHSCVNRGVSRLLSVFPLSNLLALLRVNLNFLVFSVYLDDMRGQLFALFVPMVAVAESRAVPVNFKKLFASLLRLKEVLSALMTCYSWFNPWQGAGSDCNKGRNQEGLMGWLPQILSTKPKADWEEVSPVMLSQILSFQFDVISGLVKVTKSLRAWGLQYISVADKLFTCAA